jgi:hypothetical protein
MIQHFNDKKHDLCLSNFTLHSTIIKWPCVSSMITTSYDEHNLYVGM